MEARQGAIAIFCGGVRGAGFSPERTGASCPDHLMCDLENQLPATQPERNASLLSIN
jgi:hypothetical protein